MRNARTDYDRHFVRRIFQGQSGQPLAMQQPLNLSVLRAYLINVAIFVAVTVSVWILYYATTSSAPPPMLAYISRIDVYLPSPGILSQLLSPPSLPAAPPCDGCIVSEVGIRASLSSSGSFHRKRFLFKNVHLKDEDTLAVFLPPAMPLPEPFLFDAVAGNVSKPQLPTRATYHQHNDNAHVYLNFEYTHANTIENQPQCKRWEERPVYLLFTPHTTNIWHVLNDALIGAFQTLREEGYLPLARIDAAGNMKEHTADLEDKCHKVWDIGGDHSYRPQTCRPLRGLVQPSKCNTTSHDWCQPGLVAVNRTAGPILLLAKRSREPDDKWKHLFHAVSDDIRPWESMIGTCFREIYISKSDTLNLYRRSVDLRTARFGTKFTLKLRQKAMAAFQLLVWTAELRNRIKGDRKMEELNMNKTFSGYADARLEMLRQGIGPEEVEALQVLREIRNQAIDSVLNDDEAVYIKNRLHEESINMKYYASGDNYDEEAALATAAVIDSALAPAPTEMSHRESRPVVTYMLRTDFKRGILNDADILEYILLKYNVTVRVTTFDEPLLETMDLMNSTDVLIGMHGAGWTNALFLKPGAGGLQLHPYGWMVMLNGNMTTLRGGSYANIVKLLGGNYAGWINPSEEHSFIRRDDYAALQRNGNDPGFDYAIHPQPHWERPGGVGTTGAHWIYQNTLVSMKYFAPVLESLMEAQGIEPSEGYFYE